MLLCDPCELKIDVYQEVIKAYNNLIEDTILKGIEQITGKSIEQISLQDIKTKCEKVKVLDSHRTYYYYDGYLLFYTDDLNPFVVENGKVYFHIFRSKIYSKENENG
jgi:hypothetical protein